MKYDWPRFPVTFQLIAGKRARAHTAKPPPALQAAGLGDEPTRRSLLRNRLTRRLVRTALGAFDHQHGFEVLRDERGRISEIVFLEETVS